MKALLKVLLTILNSTASVVFISGFCALSFYLGGVRHDMNLFAASGGVMTVFGLLSLIRFTTIEKYLNRDVIIANSTGLTGPPISAAQAKEFEAKSIAAAELRVRAELRSELKGIALTIIGTLIWAYGSYAPTLWLFHGKP